MHTCEEPTCTNWVRFGPRCHKHTTDDELVATFARKPEDKRYNQDRLLGIGVVTPPREVRYTERPYVGRVKPWSHVRGGTLALSDCIVTKPDGTTEVWSRDKRTPTRTIDKQASIRHLNEIATTADHDTHTND